MPGGVGPDHGHLGAAQHGASRRGSTSRLRGDRHARRPLRHLRLRARADPHRRDGAPGAGAGPGEVLVRVAVSGVNPTDWKSRLGGGQAGTASGFGWVIPNQDGAGIIEDDRPGRRPRRASASPCGCGSASGSGRMGSAAQYIVLPERQAVPLPDDATLDMGAGLGIPAMTAHRCLFADGSIDGASVLVHGGAGAVGHAAIQLARARAARASPRPSARRRRRRSRSEAGAGLVVNYREEDVVDGLRGWAPHGIDRIVEVAISKNLETDGAVLAPYGTIASYGAPDGPLPPSRDAHHEERAPRLRARLHDARRGQARRRRGDHATRSRRTTCSRCPLRASRWRRRRPRTRPSRAGSSARCSSTSRRSRTRNDRRGRWCVLRKRLPARHARGRGPRLVARSSGVRWPTASRSSASSSSTGCRVDLDWLDERALRQGYVALDGDTEVRVRDDARRLATDREARRRAAAASRRTWRSTRAGARRCGTLTEGRRVEKRRHRMRVRCGDGRGRRATRARSTGSSSRRWSSPTRRPPGAFAPPDWFGREVTEDGALQEPRARGGREARVSYRLEDRRGRRGRHPPDRRRGARRRDRRPPQGRRAAGRGPRQGDPRGAQEPEEVALGAAPRPRGPASARRAGRERGDARRGPPPVRGARRAGHARHAREGGARGARRRPPRRSARCSASSRTRRDAARAQLEGDTGLLGGRGGRARGDPRARARRGSSRDQGFDSVVAGAEILYARGREAMREALRDGDDETWHEWRKRVKDLWYSGRILAPIAGAPARRDSSTRPTSSATCSATTTTSRCCSRPPRPTSRGVRAAIVARRDGLRRRRGARSAAASTASARRRSPRRLQALLDAHEADHAASAHWIADADAAASATCSRQKAAADPAQRRRASPRDSARLGLRTRTTSPTCRGGRAASRPRTSSCCVARGIVRVGVPPDPATLAGL